MKLTKQRAAAVRKVINKHRLIGDRTKELSKKGYQLKLCSLTKGRTPTGKIHEYKHSCRLQIGYPKGYYKYTWVVVFEPLPYEKIKELNDIYFHGVAV